MSIVKHRSRWSIIKGVWTHSLSILTMFSFPYQVTVALHRMFISVANKSSLKLGNYHIGRDGELLIMPIQIIRSIVYE